jgi:hypothetical protein
MSSDLDSSWFFSRKDRPEGKGRFDVVSIRKFTIPSDATRIVRDN